VQKESTIVLKWNHETLALTVESTDITIGFAQMILDEAQRYMDEQRRLAAIHRLKNDMAEQQRVNSIVKGLSIQQ